MHKSNNHMNVEDHGVQLLVLPGSLRKFIQLLCIFWKVVFDKNIL